MLCVAGDNETKGVQLCVLLPKTKALVAGMVESGEGRCWQALQLLSLALEGL